jgi:hypothetical protein
VLRERLGDEDAGVVDKRVNAPEPSFALGDHTLGTFETKLGGYSQPHRSAPFRSERLAQKIDCQDSLWVQCAQHVDTRRVAVKHLNET